MQAEISIIVGTRNRAPCLRKLLASLERLQPPPVPYEVLIADNGSTDATPQVLAAWSGPGRRVLRVDQPGRSRAFNAAIEAATGSILVFTDDDVEVDPGHLIAVWDFFAKHDCWAAQGTIDLPAAAMTDPALRPLLQRYESTLPLVLPQAGVRRHSLVGANMLIRRETLRRIGLFNVQLGPGGTGFSDDDELADRILAHGGWIGSLPAARVTHEVDPSRLTEEYFRQRHRLQGRSRFVYRQHGLFTSILPNLVKVHFDYLVYSLLGNLPKKYRAKGRCYHYREMLRLATHGTDKAA